MLKTGKSTVENLPRLQGLRKLGKNLNGYFGETVDIGAVLNRCVTAATTHGWTVEDLVLRPGIAVPAFIRLRSTKVRATSNSHRPMRVYISAGIHGDEPAGPLAVQQLLEKDAWPEMLDLWLCPCMNPTGFQANTRSNKEGIDLNRQYRAPSAPEIIAHTAWLERQPAFDLALCVHEDWESDGFYVYELNPDNRPPIAEAIVKEVTQVCPVDRSELIEGRPAREGIIRPSLDPRSRPDWPEAFYLITHKTRLSCTLEAPSDFPLHTRVEALSVGITAALEQMRHRGD